MVKKLLKYQSTDTLSLIKMYYHVNRWRDISGKSNELICLQEKVQEQDRINNSSQSDLGKLYFRAYYHSKPETLYVESKSFLLI